jgi:hypothetical protein
MGYRPIGLISILILGRKKYRQGDRGTRGDRSSCSSGSSAMGGGEAHWSFGRRLIPATIFKSKGIGRERSGWGCSSRAHLGQGRLGEGDRRRRLFSAQEQWREVGDSGGGDARQGRGREQAGRCVVPWRARGSLYSCGKAVRPVGVEHAELVLALMAVQAARPAGFATGSRRDATAVLLDKTRRAAMQRRASRGSGWREVAGGLR